MKKIIALLAFTCLLNYCFAQPAQQLTATLDNVSIVSSADPNYTIQGDFLSSIGYTISDIAINDIVWARYSIPDPDQGLRAQITALPTVVSGNTIQLQVTILDGSTILAFPTGTLTVYRATTNLSMPLVDPLEPVGIRAQKINDALITLDANISGGGGATNLSIANQTGTGFDIVSSTGTDASVPAATSTLAGAMTAADKVKADFTTTTVAVNTDNLPASFLYDPLTGNVTVTEVDGGTTTFAANDVARNNGALTGTATHPIGFDYNTGQLYYRDASDNWAKPDSTKSLVN